ncbi:MAG: GDP-mannose 4,6-dehydratase [Porticoccaceae bacterium]|nr:GDP-mannose 4,6-dehydratase [Porticoccaceae bacterium]
MVANENKVWVVGANSFTGAYLVAALQQSGYLVDTTKVDITCASQVAETVRSICPDYVINLAAISFVPEGENASVYGVNTFGPQYILDACLALQSRPRKIVLASSASIYGVQANDKISETCRPNPVDHYGCSKWAMEQIANTYKDELNILITRPFNYTGLGQDEKFLIPKIVRHYKNKAATLQLGNLNVSRDFSNVRWIAQVYVALLALENEEQHIVNLCSGEMSSIDEVLEVVRRLTGVNLRIQSSKAHVRAADIVRQCGNNERLYQMLPTLPRPITISDTLKEMVLG